MVIAVFYISYLGIYQKEVVSNSNGVILVIKNTSNNYDFSNQVCEGINISERFFSNKRNNQPEIVDFDMAKYEMDNPYVFSDISKDLIELISKYRVLGIISGGTSLTDKTVIDVCKKMRIPLILCVSTNDELLDATTKGIVFRLPPNNSKQTEQIFQYCKNYKHIALLYENNSYGNYLYRKLSERLKQNNNNFYTLEINRANDFFYIIPYLDSLKTDLIIYLGYFSKSYDLIKKLDGYNETIPVLLSDGCYSNLLPKVARLVKFNLALSFPSQANNITSLQKGFEYYGYDAYSLLFNLHDYWAKHTDLNLSQCFKNISKSYGIDDKTKMFYEFNAYGESFNHTYNIIQIGNSNENINK